MSTGEPVSDSRQGVSDPPPPSDPLDAVGEGPLAPSPPDADAFLQLIERETLVLLKVTSALVGFADAEDAAQEAVLKAWQARASLRDLGALRPWLLRIAVNICHEWRRGRFGRWQRALQPLDDELAQMPAREEADPGANGHAAALDVRQAINALDASLRVVVALRYYAGLDATEIGEALSLPAPTVRTRLRRALTLLRQQLGDSGHLRRVAEQKGGGNVE